MASVKQIETLDVQLKTEAGALFEIYNAFREAGVNIIATWGYEMGPDQATAHFYATDTAKAKDVLTKMGKNPTTSQAVYAEGTDQVGNYADLLKKVKDAGINISATDAFALGGNFATVFFAEQADVPKLAQALNS